ncbi:hypothetical protein V5799_028373 [Amblyomma americanum]|uniref:Uncharacterized protein n=1 Tax=Amblyomma americanum TaxID=6943 RepID=A0AAQ4DD23_AMBAM
MRKVSPGGSCVLDDVSRYSSSMFLRPFLTKSTALFKTSRLLAICFVRQFWLDRLSCLRALAGGNKNTAKHIPLTSEVFLRMWAKLKLLKTDPCGSSTRSSTATDSHELRATAGTVQRTYSGSLKKKKRSRSH